MEPPGGAKRVRPSSPFHPEYFDPNAAPGSPDRGLLYIAMGDGGNGGPCCPLDDTDYGFVYPVIQYDHDEGDRAVSGGYVYRGTRDPQLTGQYVFGDLASGRVFYAPADLMDGTGAVSFSELRLIDSADHTPKSLLEMVGDGVAAPRADLRFGLDDDGEIYLVTKRDGRVRRIVRSPACQDGLDNDGDGAVDADGGVSAGLPPEQVTQPDPHCLEDGSPEPWKKRERPGRACGLGGELTLLLPPLIWLSWRRARRR